ncbi:methyltransferase [Flavimarina sp. Hel_I_48]|uniref:methyltransferase n=1 Tax=Flavimarina sp. Hel_I_48 TaxID=1392488 RepID=UPI0004DEF1F2|nr:methyltransferase [Flavimarina sp. Hel_I_48]
MIFDKDYWNLRYTEGKTGWDLGVPSPPLKEYVDQLKNKNLHILIPGAGNGHEAIYLKKQGFHNVTVIDLSGIALENIAKKYPDFPEKRLLLGDFFNHMGTYDLILEQTFFCALDPGLREDYALKMKSLLKPGGKLAGVLFDFEKMGNEPPFGGSSSEYRRLFETHFNIKTLQCCHNSVKPRKGNELFFIFENPQ